MTQSTPAKRLTKYEWAAILDAVNHYESEPANFEDDPDDKRLEALRSARDKIYDRI